MTKEHPHWTNEMIQRVQRATNFTDIGRTAVKVLQDMPKGRIGQVCGPIGTGGKGEVKANLKIFDDTIRALTRRGTRVFDQMPFEEPLQRIKTGEEGEGEKLLEAIYVPLFNSERVTDLYFIHGWESSQGSRWEHQQAKEKGINIWYLHENYLKNKRMRLETPY